MLSFIRPRRPAHVRPLLFLASAFLAACGGGGGGSNSFLIRQTGNATDANAPIEVAGFFLVYLADEGASGAQDLNGDGDTLDDVAVVVNMASTAETVLRATMAVAVVSNEIYLLVDEAADGLDWDGDTLLDDFVLLHFSELGGGPTFVDRVDMGAATSERMLSVGGRLYYQSASGAVGPDDTSLRFIRPTAPTVPVVVANVAGAGQLRPEILDEVEGLIFLALSETAPSPTLGVVADFNGDGDSTDAFVLALLDGTDETATVHNVGLALADGEPPVDALPDPLLPNDWLVGFLVDEAAQGNTNLNDQALFAQPLLPDSCAGTPDLDTLDEVLHFLHFADFVLGTALPENTGLAGIDRVLCVAGFVATISLESDANCDLNEDLDSLDRIPRWVGASMPIIPPRDPSQLHAAFDAAGGSRGLATLTNRFVMVVDEAADSDNIDGKPASNTLVGWLDPAAGFATTWTFSHPATNPGTGIPGEPFVGASWMAEEQDGRLPLAYQESVPGMNLNNEVFCGLLVKDADTIDVLPVWADFFGTTMDFDGQGYALAASNPGVVAVRGLALYRVNESADSFDYNQDGDKSDDILFRNPQTFCSTVAMATASGAPGPVIVTDGTSGAAFLTSEFQAGLDINGDGDTNDTVVRYFLF